MRILIVNNAEENITEFVDPIKKISNSLNINSDIIQYSDLFTIKLFKYDGIILSGSPKGDNIIDNHLKYYEWIKNYNKPILGICAGHHIIGTLYGSKLIRKIQGEDGNYEVSILSKDPFFKGVNEKFIVKELHNNSISLPSDFILLASSKKCEVESMKHNSKLIYTTQFHPEILNQNLIINFLSIVDSQIN